MVFTYHGVWGALSPSTIHHTKSLLFSLPHGLMHLPDRHPEVGGQFRNRHPLRCPEIEGLLPHLQPRGLLFGPILYATTAARLFCPFNRQFTFPILVHQNPESRGTLLHRIDAQPLDNRVGLHPIAAIHFETTERYRLPRSRLSGSLDDSRHSGFRFAVTPSRRLVRERVKFSPKRLGRRNPGDRRRRQEQPGVTLAFWQRPYWAPVCPKTLEIGQDRLPIRPSRQIPGWFSLVPAFRFALGALDTQGNELGMGDWQHLIGQRPEDVPRGNLWRSMTPHHANRPPIMIRATIVRPDEPEDAGGILCPLVRSERLQDRPQTLLDGIPARQGGTGQQLRQPYADKPPARGKDIGRMRQHRFFEMTENRRSHISRSFSAPSRYPVIIKVGVASADRRQVRDRPPFPESCLGNVEIGPVVLTKQTFSLINCTGTSASRPFLPRLAAAIVHTLREADDTVPDAAVTTVIRMEIFEMLAGSERGVVEP